MEESRVLSLPSELQTYIVEMIPTLSALAALCRTCSALRAITIPVLYNSLVLELDDPLPSYTRQMLDTRNPGLQSVRMLALDVGEDCADILTRETLLVLNRLSANTLLHFRVLSGFSVSFNTFLDICNTHQGLRSINISPTTDFPQVADTSRTIMFPALPRLEELYITYNQAQASGISRLARRLLDCTKNLKKLSIAAVLSEKLALMKPDGIELHKALFSENVLMHSKIVSLQHTIAVLEVSDLRLEGLQVFRTVPDLMASLKVLRIVDCTGVSLFLEDAIVAISQHPQTNLRIFECCMKTPDDMRTVELLLAVSSSLEQIYILSRRAAPPPSHLCLSEHAKSLKVLLLDCGTPYSLAEFQELISMCSNLQELGLDLPEIYLAQYPNDSMCSGVWKDSPDEEEQDALLRFSGYLTAVKNIPRLRTFSITSALPVSEERGADVRNSSSLYKELLRLFAGHIFRLLQVNFIIMGSERWADPYPHKYFSRCKQEDTTTGKVDVEARRMEDFDQLRLCTINSELLKYYQAGPFSMQAL